MIHILRLGAALGLFASTLTALPAANLGPTWEKLQQDKHLVIGYFGGSITEGAGASDGSKTSWRALVTEWFRHEAPDARIEEINAAIGGTGSDFGAFRCKRDLLDKKPDLVFLEFAVNDSEQAAKRAPYYEGIIRQILQSNPSAQIIAVYTVNKASDSYPRGETPPAVSSEQEIAGHYGLAGINVGKALSETIQSGKARWEDLTTDSTHPSDAGHKLYASEVIAFLEAHRGDRPTPVSPLPPPLHPDAVERASMVDTWTLATPGWTKENISLAGRFPHRIFSDKPGAELVLKFSGTTVGVLWLVAPDAGEVFFSIDGGPLEQRSIWDEYAKTFTRGHAIILAENLEDKEHTLRLVISDKIPGESTGRSVRIGAFLVH